VCVCFVLFIVVYHVQLCTISIFVMHTTHLTKIPVINFAGNHLIIIPE
jgi:hypothetical protein